MKRLITTILILTISSFLSAQTRVGVAPLLAPEEDIYSSAVNEAVYNTELVTLALIGTYKVTALDNALSGNLAELKDVAQNRNLDNLIIGSYNPDQNNPTITLSMYSLSQNEIVIELRQPIPLGLALFDIVDDLTRQLLERVTGRTIEFGTFELLPSIPDIEYSVFINDFEVPTVNNRVEKVLTGDYSVKIYQNRFSGELKLLDSYIHIEKGQQLKLPFPISGISDEDREKMDRIDRKVNESDKNEAILLLENTIEEFTALENIKIYSPIKRKYIQWLSLIQSSEPFAGEGFAPETEPYPEELLSTTSVKGKPLEFYFSLEALGGNLISPSAGIAFFDRKLDLQIQGSYTLYQTPEIDTFGWTIGADFTHHIRANYRPLVFYYGIMYRYNYIENTNLTNIQSNYWGGLLFGLEYNFEKFTIYSDILQFQPNLYWYWPSYSISLGAKLWI